MRTYQKQYGGRFVRHIIYHGVEESWSRELSQICNSASMSLCLCASENQNSCKFKLYRAYSISINSLNVGKLFWSWILRNCIEVLGKKESLCRVFTSSRTKHEFSHFHVVVVQWRQRNAQKSVMHVQSCCFVDLHILLFCRFRYRGRSRYLRSGRPSLRFWSIHYYYSLQVYKLMLTCDLFFKFASQKNLFLSVSSSVLLLYSKTINFRFFYSGICAFHRSYRNI